MSRMKPLRCFLKIEDRYIGREPAFHTALEFDRGNLASGLQVGYLREGVHPRIRPTGCAELTGSPKDLLKNLPQHPGYSALPRLLLPSPETGPLVLHHQPIAHHRSPKGEMLAASPKEFRATLRLLWYRSRDLPTERFSAILPRKSWLCWQAR
jgi:hypothetical protein